MTVTGEGSENEVPPGTAFGAGAELISRLMKNQFGAAIVVVLSTVLAYGPYLAVAPLLDEQFILSFAKNAGRHGVPLGSFLGWAGFDPADLWGPVATLSLKISHVLLFGAPFLLRAEGLVIHAAAAALLYFLVARIVGGVAVALTCALLFGLFPLNPEAVLWLGGRGSEIAGLLSVASMLAYQKGRSSWKWLLISLACYTAALLSSAAVWPLMLLFAVYELVARFLWTGREQSDSAFSLMGPLCFLLVTACYVAATGILWQLTTDAAPVLSPAEIWRIVRACIFPINESIWPHYARNYRFLYFLLTPVAITGLLSLVTNARLRGFVLFAFAWFALALIPSLGHVDVRGTMYGSHLLYPAALPFACLLGFCLVSMPLAVSRWPRSARAVSALFAVIVLGFYLAHVWKQNAAYDSGGRLAAVVQKSVKVVHDRTQSPNILVRGLPQRLAIGPGFSTADMIVFDGATKLVASNELSSGSLKDQLRAGNLKDVTLRWDPQLRSLVQLDLGEPPSALPAEMNGVGIAQRMMPSIEYYKIARMDTQSGEVVLESNSATSGPAIKLSSSGFVPLGADFLYLDAKIDAPGAPHHPLIELYWSTADHPDYDNKQRRLWTMALVGDGQYHRYYLPLRGIGWVTGGQATTLTLGFPAASKVWLRAMGAADKAQVIPSLAVVNADSLTRPKYNPPFLNFPTRPELGLYRFEPTAKSIKVSYACDNIPQAIGVLFEISMPYQVFGNTNGNEASGVGSTALGAIGTKGTYDLPMSSFPLPGLYSVRAIAVDRGHNQLGNFSDDMYCLITHRYRSQWSQ